MDNGLSVCQKIDRISRKGAILCLAQSGALDYSGAGAIFIEGGTERVIIMGLIEGTWVTTMIEYNPSDFREDDHSETYYHGRDHNTGDSYRSSYYTQWPKYTTSTRLVQSYYCDYCRSFNHLNVLGKGTYSERFIVCKNCNGQWRFEDFPREDTLNIGGTFEVIDKDFIWEYDKYDFSQNAKTTLQLHIEREEGKKASKEEQQKRHNKRVRIIAIAVLVSLFITTILAATAIIPILYVLFQ